MLGFLAAILMIAIFVAVVYFVFLRKVPLSLVAKALKLNMEIQTDMAELAKAILLFQEVVVEVGITVEGAV